MLQQAGLPIEYVSFDAFQSSDSVQLLRQQGFQTGKVSMDLSLLPYNVLKTAIYQGRVFAPAHDHCKIELQSLELVVNRGKNGMVDHPPSGSKDVADAMSGVVYGLTTRRDIWAAHGVPINQNVLAMKETEVKTSETQTV